MLLKVFFLLHHHFKDVSVLPFLAFLNLSKSKIYSKIHIEYRLRPTNSCVRKSRKYMWQRITYLRLNSIITYFIKIGQLPLAHSMYYSHTHVMFLIIWKNHWLVLIVILTLINNLSNQHFIIFPLALPTVTSLPVKPHGSVCLICCHTQTTIQFMRMRLTGTVWDGRLLKQIN